MVNRNDQPKFVAQSYTFSVDEDASANTDVGTVTATDEDAATSITYSVSPDTVFRVIPTTGVIQLIAANLNYEAIQSYVWLWTLRAGRVRVCTCLTILHVMLPQVHADCDRDG